MQLSCDVNSSCGIFLIGWFLDKSTATSSRKLWTLMSPHPSQLNMKLCAEVRWQSLHFDAGDLQFEVLKPQTNPQISQKLTKIHCTIDDPFQSTASTPNGMERNWTLCNAHLLPPNVEKMLSCRLCLPTWYCTVLVPQKWNGKHRYSWTVKELQPVKYDELWWSWCLAGPAQCVLEPVSRCQLTCSQET